MGRFSRLLNEIVPLSGRFIKEDGDYCNFANCLFDLSKSSIGMASVNGRVYRTGARFENLAPGFYYFAQNVKEGFLSKSVAFTYTFTGNLTYDLVLRPVLGNIVDTFNGLNLDARLAPLAKCPIVQVDSLLGGEEIPLAYSLTSTATAQKTSGSLSLLGLRGTYDHINMAGFIINVLSTTTINFVWAWEEVPNV